MVSFELAHQLQASDPNSLELLLRISVPFALGAVVTLLITAVNHRRDHIKHVRDVLSSAIQDISREGAAFWAKKFDEEALVKLRGAVVFMQHVLPYAMESCRVDAAKTESMRSLFAEISHTALHSDDDLTVDDHNIELERVARLSVCCARAEALSNTILLDKMSLWAILWSHACVTCQATSRCIKSAYNAMFVP